MKVIHLRTRGLVPMITMTHFFFLAPSELSSWKTKNNTSVGGLWIELFEYYALGLNSDSTIISIGKAGGFDRSEKNWKGKKLTIEDPFSSKRPLTRLISSVSVFDFISDCFKIAYLYFGCIQTVRGPIITRIMLPGSSQSPSEDPASQSDNPEDAISSGPTATTIIDPSKAITAEELERAILGGITRLGEQEAEATDPDASFESLLQKHGTELSPKLARRVSDLVPKNMIVFQFNSGILTAGQVRSSTDLSMFGGILSLTHRSLNSFSRLSLISVSPTDVHCVWSRRSLNAELSG